VAACQQAATLDKQMAADREAARTSIGSSGGDTGTGEGPAEAARRFQELDAKLAADQRRLEELRARCLGTAP
jgi:hypothetical protein